jgi:hypothetical protein
LGCPNIKMGMRYLFKALLGIGIAISTKFDLIAPVLEKNPE